MLEGIDAETTLASARLEAAFYRYVYFPAERQAAVSTVRQLLVEDGVRSPGWNLDRDVGSAEVDERPFVNVLASVIGGEASLDELSQYPQWTESG